MSDSQELLTREDYELADRLYAALWARQQKKANRMVRAMDHEQFSRIMGHIIIPKLKARLGITDEQIANSNKLLSDLQAAGSSSLDDLLSAAQPAPISALLVGQDPGGSARAS